MAAISGVKGKVYADELISINSNKVVKIDTIIDNSSTSKTVMLPDITISATIDDLTQSQFSDKIKAAMSSQKPKSPVGKQYYVFKQGTSGDKILSSISVYPTEKGRYICIAGPWVLGRVESSINTVYIGDDGSTHYVEYLQSPPELVRRKTEVTLNNVNYTFKDLLDSNNAGQENNLIAILKAYNPTSGSWSPLIDTNKNKMTVYNDDFSVFVKINLMGEWSGTQNPNVNGHGYVFTFPPTTGNEILQTQTESALFGQDVISVNTFFSVDKNGNMVQNGTDILFGVFGLNFTVNTVLTVVDQVCNSNSTIL